MASANEQSVEQTTGVFTESFTESTIARIVGIGCEFHRRGWALGTSGNFSAVIARNPLRLAITSSGLDKGALAPEQILTVDEQGAVIDGQGRPSDETKLHLAVVRRRDAGAVLHTHSVWSTILSEMHAERGGFEIAGYEMLKGLSGVRTHRHRERLPVLANSQDMTALAAEVETTLDAYTEAHGFLLAGHGLYTWGRDLDEARRHVEILEFLLEVVGRTTAGVRKS
ncbi:MAG: methylthioribulose 1-phosphate dehydratase [Blastocatellales bacterium]|nr:methylthioribulose 1-phosphate dehydratase [Blastocatellales bacterium]